MGKKKNKTRAEPTTSTVTPTTTVGWLCSVDAKDILSCPGYTNLAYNPEIISGVDTIARLIGSMTIHLMRNTDSGDVRVVDGLSRKIDIEPNKNMTRSMLIQWIVRTLFLEGDGNAIVYPYFHRGYLEDLRPVPPSMTTLVPDGVWDYQVEINGAMYSPDDVLHFRIGQNSLYPWKGEGYRMPLKDVADNLKQAATTEKGFMSSQWKPSLIVKVDSLNDNFSSVDGRRELLQNYVKTSSAGEPWIIPMEQMDVEQVKPLSLSDLALSDMVQLDKKTVASILGVPAFVLGVGDFRREEWNNFISSRIMPLAQMIEQELTKKILLDPALFFRFNPRSLYSYELKDLAEIADNQYVRGIMTGNEVRNWIGLPPMGDLDELVILENYIPVGMIGDQKKLIQDGGENSGTSSD